MAEPLVSVALISYDQEKFIGQALNSILMQEFDGAMEVVVADDCSTDRTAGIIERWAEKCPRPVRILPGKENMGMHRNWERAITACKGKYVALLEGDDLWTDPEKLLKQVNVLEQDPNASACFSNANVLMEDGALSDHPYVDRDTENLSAEDLLSLNFNPIPTCSTVFRRSMFEGFPAEYHDSPFADWILHSILIQNGKYLCLSETTSTYRQHDRGVWSGIDKEEKLLNKLKTLSIIKMVSNRSYHADIDLAASKQLDELLYFYREEKYYLKFFRTWLKLKSLQNRS